jgi:hypothetical protein
MAERKPETTVIRPLKVDFKNVNTPTKDWGATTPKPQGVEPHSPAPTRPLDNFPNRPQGTEE